jgi:hypothetical protein
VLGRIGSIDADAAIRALTDADAHVRLWTGMALREASAGVLPRGAVVPWLGHPDVAVRRSAVVAAPRLSPFPSIAFVPLARLLDDEDLRQSACDAFTALGLRARGAAADIVAVLEGGSHAAQWYATRALGAVLGIGELAAAVLVEIEREAGKPDTLGARVARITPERAVALLVDRLEPGACDDDLARRCAIGLAGTGALAGTVLPRIAALLDAESAAVRARALVVLAACGDAARPYLPQVLRAFDTPDHTLWLYAVALLRRFPDGAREAMPVLERAFARGDEHQRLAVVASLHELGAPTEPLLRRAAQDPVPFVRMTALAELASLPDLSDDAASELVTLLGESPDPAEPVPVEPWRWILPALERQPELPSALRPHLTELLDAASWHVFAFAATAIARPSSPDAARHPAFATLLAHAEREAVRAALTSRDALAAWLRSFATHGDAEVRGAAAALMPVVEGK